MDRWPIGSTATYTCLASYFFTEDSEVSIMCMDGAVWTETDNIKCGKCPYNF